MNWFYYDIMTTADFDALGVSCYEDTYDLENIGEVEITIVKGRYYGLIYDGKFSCSGVNDIANRNFDGMTCLVEGGMIKLGLPE